MRHILGEDLNVGCVLSWGPCWYYQKDFFRGQDERAVAEELPHAPTDVEVSGFPSSHAGHLCLLRLSEGRLSGHHAGGRVAELGPADLEVGKGTGRCGRLLAHVAGGCKCPTSGRTASASSLPATGVEWSRVGGARLPPSCRTTRCRDLTGSAPTNTSSTSSTTCAISFPRWIRPSCGSSTSWYHTLNCGYTCRISGETDFPCIYGERVGLGRVLRQAR